ncbi:MAG: MFS transporter [Propionibacteriaceae bacterium]|nr:MFS transporter [Propionibacteriaceae bacterium]
MSRHAWLLLGSRAVSALAGSMMMLALGVWAKQLTGSNTLAGLCTAAVTLPRLLGIVLGESLDRLPRRTALLVADLGTIAALVLLWLLQQGEQYWPLLLFGLAYGCLGVLAQTASPGALKAIATTDEMPRAVSTLQVINGSTLILGPVIGTTALSIWGPSWLIAITVVLLVVGVLQLSMLTVPRHDGASIPGRWAGLRLLWSDAQLRTALVTLIMAYGVIGLVDGSLYALIDALQRPPEFAGMVLAAQGVGMILGALLAPRVITRFGSLRSLVLGLLVAGLTVIGIVLSVAVVVVALGFVAVAGLSLGVVVTALGVLIQERVDQAVMGRAQAALQSAQTAPALGAMILGALLVAHVDFRFLYLGAAAGLIAVGVWGLRRSTA